MLVSLMEVSTAIICLDCLTDCSSDATSRETTPESDDDEEEFEEEDEDDQDQVHVATISSYYLCVNWRID